MASLQCTVATPTRELFSGEIYYANVPGAEGCYGVLPGHEMLLATNKSGGILTLDFDPEGNEKREFILYEGVTQIYEDVLTVLGRFGKEVTEIDADEVRANTEILRARIDELEKIDSPNEQEQAELEQERIELEWCQLQLDYVEGSAQQH